MVTVKVMFPVIENGSKFTVKLLELTLKLELD